MTDWATVASLATAGGTLVLAVATFASIRSANRSARIAERAARAAERSLLAGQRPLLVSSRLEDPEQELQFTEGELLEVRGGEAALKVSDDAIYLAVSVRNVGTGLAVLLGWHVQVGVQQARSHPPLEEFAGQRRTFTCRLATSDSGRPRCAIRRPRYSRRWERQSRLRNGW